MNVVVFNSLHHWTASKSYSVKLTNWLAENGHRLFYWGPIGEEIRDPRRLALHPDVRHLPWPQYEVIGALVKLVKFIRAEQIDVLHANLSEEHTLALFGAKLAGRNTSVIRTKHYFRSLPNGRGLRTKLKYGTFTSRLLTPCDAIRDLLINDNGIRENHIRSIYEGVDLEEFHPGTDVLQTRKSLGIPESGPLVGIVASFKETKGHPIFLDAAKIIHDRLPDVHFLIAGGGEERNKEKILEQIKRLGLENAVTVAGHVEDIPALLRCLDVGVVTSTKTDAAGRICLEYMSSGTPAVVTDIGAYPEIVLHEKTGLVVPSGNAKETAEAVCQLLQQPDRLAKMAKEARTLAEKRYSKQRFIEQIEELYRSTLAAS